MITMCMGNLLRQEWTTQREYKKNAFGSPHNGKFPSLFITMLTPLKQEKKKLILFFLSDFPFQKRFKFFTLSPLFPRPPRALLLFFFSSLLVQPPPLFLMAIYSQTSTVAGFLVMSEIMVVQRGGRSNKAWWHVRCAAAET